MPSYFDEWLKSNQGNSPYQSFDPHSQQYVLPERQVGGFRYRPHYDGAPPQTHGVDGMYPMAPMGPESLGLRGFEGPGAASPFQFEGLGPEAIPTAEEFAQAEALRGSLRAPGAGPGPVDMGQDLAASTMAGPYIPGAVMSEPSVGPMPGPSSLDTAMADAGGQGEELQRMLDSALQENFLGTPVMPRMSPDAGMSGMSQPQGRSARAKPPSKAQREVMSMFPGGMGQYNSWYASLPEASKSNNKLNNWSKVKKYLMENPRSAPEAAPAPQLPFNMMESLEAAPGPEPSSAGAPVGSVSSVGEGAVVPRAGSITAAAEDSGSLIGPAMPNPLGALAGVVGSGLKSYGQAMAPGIFGDPGASEATPVPPEAVVPAGPMFDMASNLEAAPAPYDPRSPEEQALNPMPPGVNYRYNMARNLLPGPAVTDGPQFDPRSATQQEMDPMPPGVNYSYNMTSPRHLMGGDAASTPYAPGPPEAPMGELQAPPMDLGRRDPRSAVQQRLDPMPPGVDYSYNMTSPRHLMQGGAAGVPYSPSEPSMGEPVGSIGSAGDFTGQQMPVTGKESPMDYFQGALEFGLEAGLSYEQASEEALRMAKNMNPESWQGYEFPLTEQERARKMRRLKQSARAGFERRRRERSQQTVMDMAERLKDKGTMHAPGSMTSTYSPDFQPLPRMPREEMRLPPMDLSEYRRRLMMERLLDNADGQFVMDPSAYDPMLGQ